MSSVFASGTTPRTGTAPNVGLRPTHPHSAAGIRMEPAVSVPMATETRPAATAAAEPPLEPPVVRAGFQGFLVAP